MKEVQAYEMIVTVCKAAQRAADEIENLDKRDEQIVSKVGGEIADAVLQLLYTENEIREGLLTRILQGSEVSFDE